ncbi:uncharacterized protein isoform X2 [Rhodnius prolixus]|uniref:uncharacterized protein isoform X2 n=1 Tax=Rhodnius prolixus TaxID=13249 RepID=UPI003D18A075
MKNNSPSGIHGIDNQTKEEIIANLRNIYSDLANDSIFTCSEHHKGCPALHGNVETPANQCLLQTLNGEEAIPVGMTRNNVNPAVGAFVPEAGQPRNVHANSCSRRQQVISVGCCCEGCKMEEDYLACSTGRYYQCEGLSLKISNAACCLHNVCKQTHEEIKSTSVERKPINKQISDLILKLSSIEEKINETNVNVGNIGHAVGYFSKLLNELSKNGKRFQEVYSEEPTSQSTLSLNEGIDSITKTVKTNGTFTYQSHISNAEITSQMGRRVEAQIQKFREEINPSEIAHHFDSPIESTREAAQPADTVHHFDSHNGNIRDAVKPAKIRLKSNSNIEKIGELAKPDLHQFGGRTENKVEKTYENNHHFDEQIENSFKSGSQLNVDNQTESDRNPISIEESTQHTERNVLNEISEEYKIGAPTEMVYQIVEKPKIITDDLDQILEGRARHSFENEGNAFRSYKTADGKSQVFEDAIDRESLAERKFDIQSESCSCRDKNYQNLTDSQKSSAETDSGVQTVKLLEIIDDTQDKRVSLSSDNNLKALGSNRLSENKPQTDVDAMHRQSSSASGTQTDGVAEIIEDAQVKEFRLSFENNVEAIISNKLVESKSQTHVDETGRESLAEKKYKFDIQSESCSCRDKNYQNLTDNSQVNGESGSCFKVKIESINISGQAFTFKEHINGKHKTSTETSSSRKQNVRANEESLFPTKHEESKLEENVELVETKSDAEKSASLASSCANQKSINNVDSTKKKMEKNLGLPKDTKMLSEQKSQIAKKNKGSYTNGSEHEFKQILYIVNKNELPEKAKELNEVGAEINSSKKPLSSLKKTKLTKGDGKKPLSKLTTVNKFAKNDSSEKRRKSANSSKPKKSVQLNSIAVPGRKSILNNTAERKNQQQCLINKVQWDNKHLKRASKLNYNDSCTQVLTKRGFLYSQDYCEILNIKELNVPNHEYKVYKANCKCSRKLERSSIPKIFHDKLEQSKNAVIKCTIRRISA